MHRRLTRISEMAHRYGAKISAEIATAAATPTLIC
jgi:hypothetical protein